MENDRGIYRSLPKSAEILLHQSGLIVCGMIIVICMWIWRNGISRNDKSNGIPSLKLSFYNIYGHLSLLPSFFVRKKIGLPSTTLLMNIVHGNGVLFQKDGMFCFRTGLLNNIVLTSPEAAEALATSTVHLKKAKQYEMLHPWLGTGLLTSYGKKWKTRRKLLTHSFHFEILKDFLPIFNEQSKIFVEILKKSTDEDWIDIMKPVTLCSLDIMCETTLGVRVGAQTDSSLEYVQAILRVSNVIMQRFLSPILQLETIFRLSPIGRRFKVDVAHLHDFTRNVIQQRKKAKKLAQTSSHDVPPNESVDLPKRKRKALLDLLLDVHESHEDFTEDDVREEIDTFAFEGHDTTSMGMSWAFYLIGLYPEIQAKIHEEIDEIFGSDRDRSVTVDDIKEMKYLERVLKESQRLYPSVPFFGRQLEEDFSLCGHNIKKGTYVFVNIFVLHRHSKVFPNPEKFDPDRFLPENCIGRSPFAFIPFSAGPRNCIGQRFAIMEEKTVISNVLRNFTVKSLDQRDQVFPDPELVLRSARPLRLKFTPREFPED